MYVQEEGTVLGRCYQPRAVPLGPSERTFPVAEELVQEQGVGDIPAGDVHEAVLCTRAVLVDDTRDLRLSGAALSGQEHRLDRPRGDGDLAKDPRHRLAATDDVVELELRSQHTCRVVAVVETLLE